MLSHRPFGQSRLVASALVVVHASAASVAFAQPPPAPPAPPSAQPVQPVPYGQAQPVPYGSAQPLPPPPSPPTGTTSAGGGDVIYLKNGGILRGTLIDAIPNAHARIRLETGDIATVQWSEILRIEATSRAPGLPKPAPAPAPTPKQPAPDAVLAPVVFLHVDSPKPVSIEQNRGGSWVPVCGSPCDVAVPLDGDYRIAGSGIRKSTAFRLTGQPGQHVVLRVDPSSTAGFVLGIVGVSVGSPFLFIGLLVLGVASACNSSGCDKAQNVGLVLTALGGGAVLGGIIALGSNGSSKVAQEPATNGAPAPAQARLPIWREARESGPALPAAPGFQVPLLSGTF